MEDKIKRLIDYCQGIYKKENGRELYDKHIEDIKSITPVELVQVENEQLKIGISPEDMLTFVDKLINVFYESLQTHKLPVDADIPFINHLLQENNRLIALLVEFKEIMKTETLRGNRKLKELMAELEKYNEHLLKLENLLFPYMEKAGKRFDGLKIMWTLHDQIRMLLKDIAANIDGDELRLKRLIGQLYFKLYGAVQKQELILFPSAVKMLKTDDFIEMQKQSFDYKFVYIDTPKKTGNDDNGFRYDELKRLFVSDTGHLRLAEISGIFAVLPLDLTLVDAEDNVAFFTKSKDRIFPRSSAVIGRNVRNCHPPKSVHIVEQILSALKDGTKDDASFWINMKEKTIYIQYIALRDNDSNYIGTLEITQDITDIKSIDGEHRLLDW